ncbi:CsbD family protein [Streptomyces sp. NPDC102402]|uniref:CsbD family protein n=1 Tax=Streptomyces sp. NPDC102402 TaxID=3366169 RepID=UPI003823BB81
MDKIKGKAKEATGKLTGDRRKEAEGKADQAKAKTEGALGGAGERAKGVKDSLKNDDDR